VKKITISQVKRGITASLLLLLISVTILPFNLFHHHSKESKVCCASGSCEVVFYSTTEADFTFIEIKETNPVENCLYCAWQIEGGARIVYLASQIDVFLPDLSSMGLPEFYITGAVLRTILHVPNKGPPAFLFF
jgi:hypothetical protein